MLTKEQKKSAEKNQVKAVKITGETQNQEAVQGETQNQEAVQPVKKQLPKGITGKADSYNLSEQEVKQVEELVNKTHNNPYILCEAILREYSDYMTTDNNTYPNDANGTIIDVFSSEKFGQGWAGYLLLQDEMLEHLKDIAETMDINETFSLYSKHLNAKDVELAEAYREGVSITMSKRVEDLLIIWRQQERKKVNNTQKVYDVPENFLRYAVTHESKHSYQLKDKYTYDIVRTVEAFLNGIYQPEEEKEEKPKEKKKEYVRKFSRRR